MTHQHHIVRRDSPTGRTFCGAAALDCDLTIPPVLESERCARCFLGWMRELARRSP